jgi:hypothetical protein
LTPRRPDARLRAMQMRASFWLPIACLALLLAVGCASQPRPLLSNAGVSPASFSPRGLPAVVRGDDVSATPAATSGLPRATKITYELGRPANVSIYFEDAHGQRHYFRRDQPRAAGQYAVDWNGLINDPQLRAVPGGSELVEAWVLPDGAYRWVIEAWDAQGQQMQAEGQLAIQDGDSSLPDIQRFTVVPQEFSPKQDGMRGNRVSISYYLAKAAQTVRVYLEKPRLKPGDPVVRYPVAGEPTDVDLKPNAAGYHGYSWDAGVDLGVDPPPDGDYIIYATAEDPVGNQVAVSTTLTIKEGGKPIAEVYGGEVHWQNEVDRDVKLALGDSLCFTTTVANMGPVPIRTSGPWPGQVYKFSENSNTLARDQKQDAWYQQAGVWRFGINYEQRGVDFPFRWAIGRPEDLEKRIVDGSTQYYLLPGHQGQVSGCIQFDQMPAVNTHLFWGGLIQEYVQVASDGLETITVEVSPPK